MYKYTNIYLYDLIRSPSTTTASDTSYGWTGEPSHVKDSFTVVLPEFSRRHDRVSGILARASDLLLYDDSVFCMARSARPAMRGASGW